MKVNVLLKSLEVATVTARNESSSTGAVTKLHRAMFARTYLWVFSVFIAIFESKQSVTFDTMSIVVNLEKHFSQRPKERRDWMAKLKSKVRKRTTNSAHTNT
jgi:hypothetical protein